MVPAIDEDPVAALDRRLHFVLPSGVGDVIITDELTDEDLVAGIRAYQRIVEERR